MMALCKLMNKSYLVVLALLSISIWHTASSSSISAIPASIDVGKTEALTVICGGSGSLPNMPILLSLTLMASETGPTGQFLPVATTNTIVSYQAFPSAYDGTVTSNFHPRGPSSLQVTWTNPGINVARVYRCDVVGLDARWFHTTSMDTIEVSYASSGMATPMDTIDIAGDAPVVPAGVINELSNKIRGLDIKLNNMETMAAQIGAQINKRFADIETKIKSNAADIKEMKRTAGSSSGSSSNTKPPSSPMSSLSVRAMQTQLRRLETSFEELKDSSVKTASKLSNLSQALDEVSEEGQQIAIQLSEGIDELRKQMSSKAHTPASFSPVAPVSPSSQSGDCCQAVNELQISMFAMATNNQVLTKRVDKLTMWTSAERDSNFEVSDIYEGRQYFLLKEGSEFNLDKAHWNCMGFGGYLLEVDDEAEMSFVLAFMKTFTHVNRVYTGGNDADEEKVWVFRYSQKPMKHFDWARGQPDNRRRNEDCVYINAADGKMSDGYCDMKGDYSKYVCEVPE